MKKEIPICLISDEKYPFAISATLISALENIGENSFYKIYCLLTSAVKQEDRENLLSLQKKYPDKCNLEIIDMGEDKFEDNFFHKRISNACRYKFFLGNLFPQYEKILYLDFDVLVRGDLSDLYETDISKYDIAGVFSYNHYFFSKHFLEILNIPNMNSYINAGVMLINLKTLRNKNFQIEVNNYLGSFKDSVDQHIFNKICYGKIKLVAPKYNLTLKNYIHYKKVRDIINYTNEEINDAVQNPIIFHYAGETKPWNYNKLPFAEEWLKYYAISPYRGNKLKRKSLKLYNFNKWKEKKIRKWKKIIKDKFNSYKLFYKHK